MDENQNSISEHANNTPFVALETKKRIKRPKRKNKLHTQKQRVGEQ
jgi:hypothetical protein